MKKPKLTGLQEQLLKSGLANDAKIRQVKAEKRKQDKQQRNNGVEIVDEIKLSAEQARQNQIGRDRELNRQRALTEEKKALAAQIKQLVQLNRIAQDAEGIAYQFNHANKVKTVYVNEKLREALINGRVAIVSVESNYEIVPAEVARKIKDRNADCLIVLNQPGQEEPVADDPYAAYQIPDDMMW